MAQLPGVVLDEDSSYVYSTSYKHYLKPELVAGELYINGEHLEQQFDMTDNAAYFGPYTVPEDHYFVMGDNRNNSKDSRSSMVGALPRSMIRGHVRVVIFPFSDAGVVK